jgi:cytosine deaminase
MAPGDAAAVPPSRRYVLRRARVPLACLEGVDLAALEPDVDRLALVDIEVRDGLIHSITPAAAAAPPAGGARAALARLAGAPAAADLRGRMVLPTFVDLHTHIDKGHTAERSRNPDGSLSGADRSTAADAAFWDTADVERRMDFALRCAYAHGTSALRTHLINMTPKQAALTWPAFAALRARWAGRVELQGVSLVTLSFYRDLAAATALADTVAVAGGLLGAAVCCAEDGGDPADDFTTCEADRDLLLDRIFSLAKERDLDLDFHTDENGNAAARGLRYVSLKAIEHGYEGRVVCGHCCSLAAQPPAELAATLAAAAAARVTLVSLPLINLWTQDRHKAGGRTPRWRGVALLHEAAAAGVRVALASDNTRDQVRLRVIIIASCFFCCLYSAATYAASILVSFTRPQISTPLSTVLRLRRPRPPRGLRRRVQGRAPRPPLRRLAARGLGHARRRDAPPGARAPPPGRRRRLCPLPRAPLLGAARAAAGGPRRRARRAGDERAGAGL